MAERTPQVPSKTSKTSTPVRGTTGEVGKSTGIPRPPATPRGTK